MESCPYLFVYGTLRRGYDNPYASLLASTSEWVGQGKVQGKLYRIAHYPGLVASDHPGDWVVGDIFRVNSLQTLDALDRYEAEEFERVERPVIFPDGQAHSCMLYLFTANIDGFPQILSGDFCAL